MRKLQIAQIAPLYESVPPKLYGGTERVVSYLTEALVARGHDVCLFASGDSRTDAELHACCERSLRLDRACVDPLAPHVVMLEKVARLAPRFDVLHFHVDYLAYPTARRLGRPALTTLHGRLDLPELPAVYEEFADAAVVSISMSQRAPLPRARWVGRVHHGLPPSLYRAGPGDGGYLAFVGRISPEKRVDDAIRIAEAAGVPLRIAAKVDDQDRTYFEEVIRPLLRADSIVELVGEIGDQDKQAFLGEARALLFPIDWPEPFGLAMIEALACGTPVIARRRGAVPEIVEHGVNGYIIDSLEDGVEAVRSIDRISRDACRRSFEDRFTAARMAEDYEQIYHRLVERKFARGAA